MARQTDLDILGIPAFGAFRPNSRSLSCNQGKGVDDAAARASAVMEAVEYAIAENPDVEAIRATLAGLVSAGWRALTPERWLPLGERLDPDRPIDWLTGKNLVDGEAVLVPAEVACFQGGAIDVPGLYQTTNGLASGNTSEEAILHALCELIERDGNTLWSVLDEPARLARCLLPESIHDATVQHLLALFDRAGIEVRLFDQTTDLGIPAVIAVSLPRDTTNLRYFDVAAGAGAHLDYAEATVRALTEAAQTRVTSIAGARDDVRPDDYRRAPVDTALVLSRAEPTKAASDGLALPQSAADLLAELIRCLANHHVSDIVAVPLGGEDMGVSVVRVIAPQLEDRGPNRNWRPGLRALRWLMA